MNKPCILLLSILVIGCYSIPMEMELRETFIPTTILPSEEQEPYLEKDEPIEDVLESEINEILEKEDPISESDEPVEEVPESDQNVEEQEEPAYQTPAKLEEPNNDKQKMKTQQIKEQAKYEKSTDEPKADIKKPLSDIEIDDELQAFKDDDKKDNNGLFGIFNSMWTTVTSLSTSLEHWRRMYQAFSVITGIGR